LNHLISSSGEDFIKFGKGKMKMIKQVLFAVLFLDLIVSSPSAILVDEFGKLLCIYAKKLYLKRLRGVRNRKFNLRISRLTS